MPWSHPEGIAVQIVGNFLERKIFEHGDGDSGDIPPCLQHFVDLHEVLQAVPGRETGILMIYGRPMIAMWTPKPFVCPDNGPLPVLSAGSPSGAVVSSVAT